MEAYIDDMLIKSHTSKIHVNDLEETFATLRKYQSWIWPNTHLKLHPNNFSDSWYPMRHWSQSEKDTSWDKWMLQKWRFRGSPGGLPSLADSFLNQLSDAYHSSKLQRSQRTSSEPRNAKKCLKTLKPTSTLRSLANSKRGAISVLGDPLLQLSALFLSRKMTKYKGQCTTSNESCQIPKLGILDWRSSSSPFWSQPGSFTLTFMFILWLF